MFLQVRFSLRPIWKLTRKWRDSSVALLLRNDRKKQGISPQRSLSTNNFQKIDPYSYLLENLHKKRSGKSWQKLTAAQTQEVQVWRDWIPGTNAQKIPFLTVRRKREGIDNALKIRGFNGALPMHHFLPSFWALRRISPNRSWFMNRSQRGPFKYTFLCDQ